MSAVETDQYAWTREVPGQTGGIRLQPGDTLHGSRGEVWTFERVSRLAYGNSSGRVQVARPCPNHDDSPGHFWCSGVDVREFFPHVFNLYLGDKDGVEQ